MINFAIYTVKKEDGFDREVFDTLEKATKAAYERAEKLSRHFTRREIEKYHPVVVIDMEEDGEYITSVEYVEVRLEEEQEDDDTWQEERHYGAPPWDAPGMKMSDFL